MFKNMKDFNEKYRSIINEYVYAQRHNSSTLLDYNFWDLEDFHAEFRDIIEQATSYYNYLWVSDINTEFYNDFGSLSYSYLTIDYYQCLNNECKLLIIL